MELLLLLVILPAVQDQNHTREWLKHLIRAWCGVAAYVLNLRSYLFGDVPLIEDQINVDELDEDVQIAQEALAAQNILNNNNLNIQNVAAAANANNRIPREENGDIQQPDNANVNDEVQPPQHQNPNEQQIDGDAVGRQPLPEVAEQQNPAAQLPLAGGGLGAAPAAGGAVGGGGGLGAVHQALLLREGPTGFQPYNRPNVFALRVRISVTYPQLVNFSYFESICTIQIG